MIADEEEVSSLHSLLQAMECDSLLDVEAALENSAECFVWVYELDPGEGEGIEIRVGCRSTGLTYPFPFGWIWSTLADLEAENAAEAAYEELADQIAEIEGFHVGVMITYEVDPASVKSKHRRRELDNGVVVQFPSDYPYRRPMKGSKTIANWVAERFQRNYPGLEAFLVAPGDRLCPATTLSDLRSLAAHATDEGRACGPRRRARTRFCRVARGFIL